MSSDRFDKIEEKINKILESCNDIDKKIEINTVKLEYYISRTVELESKILPLEKFNVQTKFLVAIIVFVATITAIYKNIN